MKDLSVLKALLLQEMDEAEKCNECGGLMEKGMCTECGYMEELTKGQEKIDVAEPKGKITAADFVALRAKKDMKEDHEVGMAQNSLESIIKSAMELKAKLGDDERNIPGWIQDHITNAENYIDQASQGFHELDSHDQEHDMDELPDGTEELPAGDEEDMTLQGLMEKLLEAKKKPSAGLTKKQKSAISKKAKAGKDIGKKGKGFEKIASKAAEKYGSKERGQAVAAAAMWKGQAKKAMKEAGPSIANVSKEQFKAEDVINWFANKYKANELKYGLPRQIKSFVKEINRLSEDSGYIPANLLFHTIENFVAEVTPQARTSSDAFGAEDKAQRMHSKELYNAIRREVKMYDRKGNPIN